MFARPGYCFDQSVGLLLPALHAVGICFLFWIRTFLNLDMDGEENKILAWEEAITANACFQGTKIPATIP